MLFAEWHNAVGAPYKITPLAELEKQEITRALSLLNGDVAAAAKALQVGKTTLYRKTRKWGYIAESRVLIHQASALSRASTREAGGLHVDIPT
jgi:hypothetical protein